MNTELHKIVNTLIPYTAVSFLLNFFWESWHGILLYAGGNEYSGTIISYLQINTIASLQDAGSLFLLFVFIAFVCNNFCWYQNLNYKNVSLFATISVGGAYITEWYATEVGDWWQYNDVMPMVGTVGLSPLLQILITGTIAISLIRMIEARTEK